MSTGSCRVHICLLATLSLLTALLTPASVAAQGAQTEFGDTRNLNREAQLAVSCMTGTSIIEGTSETTFAPSVPVTRVDMALFMAQFLELFDVPVGRQAVPQFSDTSDLSPEARSAISRIARHGITLGTSANTYSPLDTVNRQQMALFISRLIRETHRLLGNRLGVVAHHLVPSGFTDTIEMSDDLQQAILYLQLLDITQGTSASRFSPTRTVSRQQMALFLTRTLASAVDRLSITAPHACEESAETYASTARPTRFSIAVPQSASLGEDAMVTVQASDYHSSPLSGVQVQLWVDDSPVSAVYLTGSDGSVSLPVPSRESAGIGRVSAELRTLSTLLRTREYEIIWTEPRPQEPGIHVRISDRQPVVGEFVDVVVFVNDSNGEPVTNQTIRVSINGKRPQDLLATAGIDSSDSDFRDFPITGEGQTNSEGIFSFRYPQPMTPDQNGGYESFQFRTDSLSSVPVGIHWQNQESVEITLSIDNDTSHTGNPRILTANVRDSSLPVPNERVELFIDGVWQQGGVTNSDGAATFSVSSAVHGPFDLAKVILARDWNITSNEVLFSWPMRTRGVDSRNDWQLTWSDDFNGETLDTEKWRAVDNCAPVYLACETSRIENVEVTDGFLYLRTLREPYSGINDWGGAGDQFGPTTTYTPGVNQTKDFTAARVDTRDRMTLTFGRVEMLGRLPQGHGTFFAYWLRPAHNAYGAGASSGEIDIAEGANIGVGGVDAQLPGNGWGIHQVVHMGYPFSNPHTLTQLPVNPAESFHLYSVEWDTDSIRFYIDDERVYEVPRDQWFSHPKGESRVENENAPFDQPFYLVINNTVGNWAVETLPGNRVPDATIFPAQFVVDYVRIYECVPDGGKQSGGRGCETP